MQGRGRKSTHRSSPPRDRAAAGPYTQNVPFSCQYMTVDENDVSFFFGPRQSSSRAEGLDADPIQLFPCRPLQAPRL